MAAGKEMPAFNLPGVNTTVALNSADYKGKVVVVNFWATWCPSCRKEIGSFKKLTREYADNGVVIVGFSVDKSGQSTVEKYIKKMGINYPIAMSRKDLANDFGPIIGIPATFFVNKQGVIVKKYFGYLPYKKLVAAIDDLLAQ